VHRGLHNHIELMFIHAFVKVHISLFAGAWICARMRNA
jgi:hypothetical protein